MQLKQNNESLDFKKEEDYNLDLYNLESKHMQPLQIFMIQKSLRNKST